MDALARVAPVTSVITEDAMAHFTGWVGSEDDLVVSDLAIRFRPLVVTLRDTICSLREAGRITARQAGRLASGADGAT